MGWVARVGGNFGTGTLDNDLSQHINSHQIPHSLSAGTRHQRTAARRPPPGRGSTNPPADTVSGARPPRPPGGSGLRFQLLSQAHAARIASEQGGSRPGPGPPGTVLDPAPG